MSTTTSADLVVTAREWAAHDPDETTRAELSTLTDLAEGGDEGAQADLASRFVGPLAFGTAGLRGEVGAGESRMNRAVVIRATAGLRARPAKRHCLVRSAASALRQSVAAAVAGRRNLAGRVAQCNCER